MARYYFDSFDGTHEKDDTGIECDDIQELRLQAVLFAGEMLKERPERLWAHGELRIIVTDEEGKVFTIISVKEFASARQ